MVLADHAEVEQRRSNQALASSFRAAEAFQESNPYARFALLELEQETRNPVRAAAYATIAVAFEEWRSRRSRP